MPLKRKRATNRSCIGMVLFAQATNRPTQVTTLAKLVANRMFLWARYMVSVMVDGSCSRQCGESECRVGV
jgi:hypothetical protein